MSLGTHLQSQPIHETAPKMPRGHTPGRTSSWKRRKKRHLSKNDLCKGCPVGQPLQEATEGQQRLQQALRAARQQPLPAKARGPEGALGKWKCPGSGGKENTLKHNPITGRSSDSQTFRAPPDPSAGIGTLCGVARREVCTRKALRGLKKEDSSRFHVSRCKIVTTLS